MPQASLYASVRIAVIYFFLGAAATQPIAAQEAGGSGLPQVRWWHGMVALGGYALLTGLDDEIQGFVRDNRSGTTDDIAGFTRHLGQPEVYGGIGLGILATGLIAGDRDIRDAGIRVSGSLALAGVFVTAAKFTSGRSRPSQAGSDADDFSPFSGHTSAPSGHAAMAFALATSLSDEIHNPWVTAGLYTLAAGTAWSRVNDDVHWFSDVVAGAAVGIVSARFINGRLNLFGIKPPSLRPTRSGITVGWTGTF